MPLRSGGHGENHASRMTKDYPFFCLT
jgi:hypothetical protein